MSTLQTMLRQIGTMNVMAVSGGRVDALDENTLRLPVANGYKVDVEYRPGSDDYAVRRVTVRKSRGVPVTKVKGEVTGIYASELGEMAYQASCFRNVDFG